MYRFVSSRRLDHRFSQPCWAGDKQRRTSTACSSRNPCGLRRFEHRSGQTQQSRALLEVADPLDVLSRKRRAPLRGPLPGTTTYQIRAPFGERDELTAGDDEVVERADVDQRQRLLERLGQTIACRPPRLYFSEQRRTPPMCESGIRQHPRWAAQQTKQNIVGRPAAIHALRTPCRFVTGLATAASPLPSKTARILRDRQGRRRVQACCPRQNARVT